MRRNRRRLLWLGALTITILISAGCTGFQAVEKDIEENEGGAIMQEGATPLQEYGTPLDRRPQETALATFALG